MVLSARLGQFGLALPFAETGAVGIGIFARAAMAGDARPLFGAGAILGRKGAAAGVAQIVMALTQPVAKADALIKNEAFALPKAVGFGHVFQIFQDAALQVIDILDPLRD